MIVTPTEDDIFAALGKFLQDILPLRSTGPDVKFIVVVGQTNRVSEPVNPVAPIGSNYIVMWPLRMPRLGTDIETLAAGGLQATFQQPSQCVIQLDVHGDSAFNNASIVSTMFRSSYCVDFFRALGAAISPLYADDPRNMPFSSGEQQYEDRYIVEANLQVDQTVTTVAQSATALSVGIASVETPPASWPNSVASAP